MQQATAGHKVVAFLVFALMSASLGFVLGAGGGRYAADEDPNWTLLGIGAALFALSAVVAFGGRAVRPEWGDRRDFGAGFWAAIGLLFLVAVILGAAVDVAT